MILKWITCSVPHDLIEAFSAAQKAWSAINSQPGFIAQCGGFHQAENSLTACIMALWQNEQAYQQFMHESHDKIYFSNEQKVYFNDILISLFIPEMTTSGEKDTLECAMQSGEILRVATCHVLPGRVDHFVEVQKSIWNPGMQKTEGYLGGAFWKQTGDPNLFLVSSFWRDVESHQNYRQNIFPELHNQARPDLDCAQITGYLVPLLVDWTVLPSGKKAK